MTIHVPSDLELTFPYRELVAILGPVKSAFLIQRFWSDLAFQAKIHGNAGRYAEEYVSRFDLCMTENGIANASDILVQCKFCTRKQGVGLDCQLFADFNYHLDKSYVPPTLEWAAAWSRYVDLIRTKKGPELNKKITRAAWYWPNAEPISEAVMNRALALIHGLDIILVRRARDPEELGIGIIQSACAICRDHSDTKVTAVLKRFMSMCRPLVPRVSPKTTEEVLSDFSAFIAYVYPDEGFEAWLKAVEIPRFDEEKQRTEAIHEEIRKLREREGFPRVSEKE